MATDIEQAIALVENILRCGDPDECPACHAQASNIVNDLVRLGWTLIPPATDDLPEGWEWRLNQNSYLVDHDGSSVAALLVAKVNNTPFAPWVADRVTRLLAALGEG